MPPHDSSSTPSPRPLRSRRGPSSPRPRQARPRIEAREDRTVFAGTVKLSQGILTITGTAAANTVSIRQDPGPRSQPPQIVVTLDGETSTFKVTLVTQIRALLGAGNDAISLDESSLL